MDFFLNHYIKKKEKKYMDTLAYCKEVKRWSKDPASFF